MTRYREWLLGSFLFALCVLWWIISIPSSFIESFYSRGLYPFISGIITTITGAIPFSLATVLLLTLPLIWLSISIRSFQKRQTRVWVFWWLWRTLISLAVLYLLFVLLWGANYRRQSVETLLGLSNQPISQTNVETLAQSLQKIVETNLDAPREGQAALTAIKDTMTDFHYNLTGNSMHLPQVKRLPPGWLILSGRASGVMSPWTLEAHVDGALPEVSRIAVEAHELAHVLGFAGEADADLISALAGLNANHAYARYAVALHLWWETVATFPQEQQQNYLKSLPAQARADLETSFEPYRRYRLPRFIQTIQQQSYNRYLKSQGVEAGIADYSRIVTLLVKVQQQNRFLQLP